ncbi:hypothetical protein Tco_1101340, partial [Tanacetum coccineum]
PSSDYTLESPDYSPASDSKFDPSEDPSSDHIPPLPAISPFLSSVDDTTYNDPPDTPPSPTYGTPFTKITYSTQRSPVLPRHRVMILASGQPIPHGRPYHYHLNGPIHMMTARKRVGPLPIQQLAMRHSVDHSSSDYFSLDDSAQDSSSDSSSEASSDFHSDASSDSSSRHSLSDHSSPDLPSTFVRPSRKRRRSAMTSVPTLPPIAGALSPVRADLIPSPKRIRSPESATDLEDSFEPYVPREVGLGVDVEDESSGKSRSRGIDIEVDDDVERSDGMDIDPVEAVIEACFDFADIIKASGVNVRVGTVTVARDDVETGTRDPIVVSDDGDTPPMVPEVIYEPAQDEAAGSMYETLGDLVKRFHDHTEAIPVHRILVIERVRREQGYRIVGVESAVTALILRMLSWSRDITGAQKAPRVVESRELTNYARHMPNTRSGASMTYEEVEELVTRRVAKEMEARKAAMNLEPLNENGDEQEGGDRGNRNEGNRGNGNGGNEGNGNGGNGENGNGKEMGIMA